MKLAEVGAHVAGVQHMTSKQGKQVYEHILQNKPERILELGFAHGTSSCYMAAALDELGGDRKLLTIDREQARKREPNIIDLLERCGLARWVDAVFAETSYTWELMQMLDQSQQPRFDFVYIDGAHMWDPDGFAFLLVDRLLKPGGWVLFDDLNWTLSSSPSMKVQPWVLALPEDQRTTPQIRKVFELLVKTHPAYTDFIDREGWGWAHKRAHAPKASVSSSGGRRWWLRGKA
jgi:predicted O-methyltransferase YrrM